ncbi:hypothetical protein Taro_020093 [Colocasia esculenta]|uniref:Transcription repressor n=1 Tax=Colocasia esculenta TaxID=4460 RepID=A0A843V7F1_COLES|nr:hypothetical protein [Colocasia esculenta]
MGNRKSLQKSLKIYLSRVRKAMQVEVLRQHSIPARVTSSRLLSACKHPRTPSFAAKRHKDTFHDVGTGGGAGPAATLADVDRFLLENFNSLYTSRGDDDDGGVEGATPRDDYLVECFPTPHRAAGQPPDAAQCLIMSPGTSNSLVEEARPSTASTTSSSYSDASSSSSEMVTRLLQAADGRKTFPAISSNSVAVMTFSKDPYEDFQRSMEEMVEARHADPLEPLDWDFMEELLMSYLELNDRCVHKHILGAFTDLAVAFRRRRAPPSDPAGVFPLLPPPAVKGRKGRPLQRSAVEGAWRH